MRAMLSRIITRYLCVVLLLALGKPSRLVLARGTPIDGPDPYADAVTYYNEHVVFPDHIIGQPTEYGGTRIFTDGIIEVDMGTGEEGTGDLQLTYGSHYAPYFKCPPYVVIVTFYNSNREHIYSTAFPITECGAFLSTVVQFHQPWAYRFVRIQCTGWIDLYALSAEEYIRPRAYIPSATR